MLVDQFEPGDRARDLRRRVAADPLLARRRRALHGVRPPRARRSGASSRRETGQELMVECGVAWFAHREDGWEAAVRARDARRRGSRASGSTPADAARSCSRASAPATSRSCCYEPEAGVLRPSARCRRWPRRRPRTARGWSAAARRRTATRRCSRTARGSRPTPSCGRAAPGSGGCSAGSSPLTVTRQELLFFDGGPAWRRPAYRAGSTTTARCTARATSTASA